MSMPRNVYAPLLRLLIFPPPCNSRTSSAMDGKRHLNCEWDRYC
jgi:hypothetical protein